LRSCFIRGAETIVLLNCFQRFRWFFPDVGSEFERYCCLCAAILFTIRCHRANVLFLPLNSMVRNRRMFPLLSFKGPVLLETFFRGLGVVFFTGGGLNSIRNADFSFPLERDAPFVLTEGLDLFVLDCAEACRHSVAIKQQQTILTRVTQNIVECFQWSNYRSLRAFCFAFKIGFSR